MTAHTAPPYRIGGGGNLIAKDDGDEFTIAFVRASPWGGHSHDALLANAEYIVRACNAHDALVHLLDTADAIYSRTQPSAEDARRMMLAAVRDAKAALG